MVEFGDELIIEIPWLIWIQLLVMFLLILLLCFGFTSDPSGSSSDASSAGSSSTAAPPAHRRNPDFSSGTITAEEHTTRRGAGTRDRSTGEDNRRGEESSLKASPFWSIFRHPNHPCNYIGLAKQALLKCFGLDSSSETSSNHQHEKQE